MSFWIVSFKNGKVINEFTDEKIVGTFRKDECLIESPIQFLSNVDERIYHRQLEIEELQEMRDKLLLNSDFKRDYDNLSETQLICYREFIKE